MTRMLAKWLRHRVCRIGHRMIFGRLLRRRVCYLFAACCGGFGTWCDGAWAEEFFYQLWRGVTPRTTSKCASSSPAFDFLIGLKSIVTESRAFGSRILR